MQRNGFAIWRRMDGNHLVATQRIPEKTEEESDDRSGEACEDLAQAARDQLAKTDHGARFQGHGMTRLVDAVLRARGYTTYLSPEGPDKGVDILAAPEPMGFGEPRVCVQVKSSDSALDRPTLGSAYRCDAERPSQSRLVGFLGWVQVQR